MTGRYLIQKLLESGIDLDKELVVSHESYAEMIISGEKTMDNWYAIESISDWTHPDEHREYARIVLK